MTCSRARRLRLLAGLFLVEDRGRERRGATGRSVASAYRVPPFWHAADRTAHLTRVSGVVVIRLRQTRSDTPHTARRSYSAVTLGSTVPSDLRRTR